MDVGSCRRQPKLQVLTRCTTWCGSRSFSSTEGDREPAERGDTDALGGLRLGGSAWGRESGFAKFAGDAGAGGLGAAPRQPGPPPAALRRGRSLSFQCLFIDSTVLRIVGLGVLEVKANLNVWI